MENFAKVSELNMLLGSELGVAGLFSEICITDSQCVAEKVVCKPYVDCVNLRFLQCHTLLSHSLEL